MFDSGFANGIGIGLVDCDGLVVIQGTNLTVWWF